jgi:hypothetical protein
MSHQPTTRNWVRGTLAEFAADETDEKRAVGELDLAPFQTRAARRGTAIARRYGGVIVADAVGLGKTRVSLAIVEALRRERRLGTGGHPVQVCVPARLREQWRRKLQKAGIEGFRMCSHTEMSRTDVAATDDRADPAVVLVDEAHRFRNPSANRSEELARLAARAPVVMATATPVCNSIWDLYHLLAMFVAEHDVRPVVGFELRDAFERAEAGDFDLTELVERLVIRRTVPPSDGAFGRRPSVDLEMLRYEPGDAEAWVWANLEGRLRDLTFAACSDQWPRELFVEYALRRWESGPQALLETLEKLVAYHRRWLEARRHGRRLDRADFRELFGGPSRDRQEVFPWLFPAGDTEDDQPADVEPVRDDLERLETLADRVRRVDGDDLGPLSAIVDLAASTDDKLLIFTRYRHAASGIESALREALGNRARVGLATGDRARATGLGRCSLDELLRRFAPRSYGDEPLPDHQQIRVLVATDCLSEGVNLQDCGRVVLADLPYSALVVEQRVGRFVRPGGPHETVRVYLPRPADWNDTLGLRSRLRRKFEHADMSGAGFTAAGPVLEPGDADEPAAPADPDTLDADRPAAESTAAVAAEPDTRSLQVGPGRSRTRTSRRPVGAKRMALPTDADEPLASLTKLDALASRLDAAGADTLSDGWEARAPIDQPALWLYVERRRATRCSPRWLLVDHDGSVAHRRAALVDSLVALADADLELTRAELPEPLLEAGRRWVRHRREQMEAVALAPVPLEMDAPQHRLWRSICQWREEGELARPDGDIEQMRRQLLRPFPRGTRRHLGELLGADLPPARTYREVRRIIDRFDDDREAPGFDIVTGVCLQPRGP